MSYQFHESKVKCHHCPDKALSKVKDLQIKLGGLICPKCNVILFYPYDGVYIREFKRRKSNNDRSRI